MTNQPLDPRAAEAIELFVKGTEAAESTGNPRAENPITHAMGLFQFLPSTWRGVVARYGQSHGVTPDPWDPDNQRRALRAVAENEYLPAIKAAGRPVTPGEFYGPHFLGAGGYGRIARADPNASAETVPNWNGVYGSNRGVFGDNKDITAGVALDKILGYWNRKAGPLVAAAWSKAVAAGFKAPVSPAAPSPHQDAVSSPPVTPVSSAPTATPTKSPSTSQPSKAPPKPPIKGR
jgi:hypothetical protein